MYRIILKFLLFYQCSFFSQELNYELINDKKGLLSKEVYDLVIDDKDYVYATTQYGVFKYNGEKFEQVCTNIPLSESIFYCLKIVEGKKSTELSNTKPSKGNKTVKPDSGMQLSFFQLDDPVLSNIRDTLEAIDINMLTPIEAMMKLNEIKKWAGGK